MKFKLSYLVLLILLISISVTAQKKVTVLEVPGTKEYSRIDSAGRSVLPSGRYITPAGQFLRITHDPFGLAISPDGKKAITLHNGVVTLIDLPSMAATRIPPYGQRSPAFT